MRWGLLWTLLFGCSFDHGTVLDGGTTGDDAPDGPLLAHTRLIDITDGQVIDGPHPNFPLLVSLSALWLKSAAAGGPVASDQGFDIVFSADRGGTQRLVHEVEAYRGMTGDLVAWVKLPALEPTTTLYIHYGDPMIATSQESPAEVWSGYAGVWHLGANLRDSRTAVTGANTGSVDVDARIDRGRSFDGMDDQIDFGSATAVDSMFAAGGSVEAWLRPRTFGGAARGRIFDKSDANTGETGWIFSVDNANSTSSVLFSRGGTGLDGFWGAPTNSIVLNTWTHVALVYDSSAPTTPPVIYLNGQPVVVTPLGNLTGVVRSDDAMQLRLGGRLATDRTFDGLLDEARVSKVPRSTGWFDTQYRNQNQPLVFYSISDEL